MGADLKKNHAKQAFQMAPTHPNHLSDVLNCPSTPYHCKIGIVGSQSHSPTSFIMHLPNHRQTLIAAITASAIGAASLAVYAQSQSGTSTTIQANSKKKKKGKKGAKKDKGGNQNNAKQKLPPIQIDAPAPKFPAATPGQSPAQLKLVQDSHIAFIGGGLGSRMNIFNEFETELHRRYPTHKFYIRNLCKEGDTPAFRPHPSRTKFHVLESLPDGGKSLVPKKHQTGKGKGHYETPDQWLTRHKIDTIIGFFGYSESFNGSDTSTVDLYKKELRAFIKHTLAQAYSGNKPQLAIVGPAAFEDQSDTFDLPDGKEANARLEIYSQAMQQVCKEEGVLFVDAYALTSSLYHAEASPLTLNGHNLTKEGYKKFSPKLADKLFGKGSPKGDYTSIHKAVAEKNRLWLLDYKIPNGVHVHGGRFQPHGDDNYPEELYKTRQMTHIRDKAIWAANTGQKFDVEAADKKTITLSPISSNSNRPVKYLSGKEVEKHLKLAPGYKVELFACEKQFPELANPSQMAFDNKGNLWVGCMGSYPHYRIGDPLPNDKILIFKDTDKDGKADKVIPFVENIHIPMGFEITEHGVFVSLGNDLVLFKDTDGDDRADTKELIISGFDDHDTHHAISGFCASPSGAVYMGEGVFSHTNVETAYGPVRGTNGGFYRYNHNKRKLERTAQLNIPNPWGIAFDDWGQSFFLHTSNPSFSWMGQGAIKPMYGQNLKLPSLIKSNAVRPTSGLEFVSSRHFPDEVQGDFILCNNIKYLGAKQHSMKPDKDGFFQVSFRHDLFHSPKGYEYFRPVDLEFAPDGSLYFLDWSNVLIGHMQHNARDPKRDHVHGRVYRITYPSRPLVPVAEVAGASIENLLENLKLHEYRTRYRTKRELRGRDHEKVYAATVKWAKALDRSDAKYEHHLLEALWVTWGINKIDVGILEQLLTAKDYRARAAAVKAVRFNADKLPKAAEYLLKAAEDEKAVVRHEAIVQASWMEPKTGTQVVAAAKKHPVTSWTKDTLQAVEANLKGSLPNNQKPVPLPPHIAKSGKRPLIRAFETGYHAYHHGESCANCHQANGQGIPNAFPPLDGSKWVMSDKELLGKIVLHGVQGPITVKGKPYAGYMQGFIHELETPEKIAGVMTYIRNAWGNKSGDLITAKDVEALIKKTKKQTAPYKADDLLKQHKLKK